jgi:hypothetical protein
LESEVTEKTESGATEKVGNVGRNVGKINSTKLKINGVDWEMKTD